MTKIIYCIKLNQELEALDYPPVPGELGQKILNTVSKEAWSNWLKQQTMIINENRLNLAEETARKYLRQQMEYYFFGSNT